MNGIFTHKFKVFFVYLSLSIVAILVINSSLYTHSHIDEYGQLIYHAHPFSSADDIPLPLKDSNHSNSHLYILSHVLILFIVFSLFLKLKEISVSLLNIIVDERIYYSHCVCHYKQRGPPLL